MADERITCAGEKPVCEVIPRRFTDGPAQRVRTRSELTPHAIEWPPINRPSPRPERTMRKQCVGEQLSVSVLPDGGPWMSSSKGATPQHTLGLIVNAPAH